MLFRYCLNDFKLLLLLLLLLLVYACTPKHDILSRSPGLIVKAAADDDNCHFLSILRKIILNQQGKMLHFIVYVRYTVSLVATVFQSCSVFLEMKGAA